MRNPVFLCVMFIGLSVNNAADFSNSLHACNSELKFYFTVIVFARCSFRENRENACTFISRQLRCV